MNLYDSRHLEGSSIDSFQVEEFQDDFLYLKTMSDLKEYSNNVIPFDPNKLIPGKRPPEIDGDRAKGKDPSLTRKVIPFKPGRKPSNAPSGRLEEKNASLSERSGNRAGMKVTEIVRATEIDDEFEVVDIRCTTPSGKVFSLKESGLLPSYFRIIRTDEEFGELDPVINYSDGSIIYGKDYIIRGRIPKGSKVQLGWNDDDNTFRYVDNNDAATGTVTEKKYFTAPMKEGFFLRLLAVIGRAHIYNRLPPAEKRELELLLAELDAKKVNRRGLNDLERFLWEKYTINLRHADIWALDTLRQLSTDGIDLEPNITSDAEMAKFLKSFQQ